MTLLITGASGLLGAYLLREARSGGEAVVAWSGARAGEREGVALRPVDFADPGALTSAFREARPDVILHAAAISSAEACRRDPGTARLVNTDATARLAALAAKAKARLVFVSTDLVFDGEHAPYREEDPAVPVSVYGRTKLEAEGPVRAMTRGLVARVSLLYGPSLTGRPSFFDEQTAALRAGRPVTLFADEWRTPLDLPTAAGALLALARCDATGLLHVGGPERRSRLEMGLRLAEFLGVPATAIVAARRADVPAPEPRPRDVALDSSRWRGLFPGVPWPTLAEALPQLPWPGS